MALSRRNALRLLLAAATILVVLVISLLVALHRPAQDDAEEPRFEPAPSREDRRAELPDRASLPRRSYRAASPARSDDGRPRLVSPAPSNRIRQPAPATVPAEISRETDPRRRAELLRMHRLATARVRASVLKRRQALLANTIAAAREGGASPERISQLEREMAELRIALQRAEHELSRASEDASAK